VKAVEITWYGHACFRLRSSEATLVTDPFDREVGYPLPRVRADIVTVSHGHGDHNYVQAVRGEPRVVEGPGEYEIKGVFITGIASYHDAQEGAQRGRNTIYLIEMEGMGICHLGDLGHIPDEDTLEILGDANILLIPVGGGFTMDGVQGAELVGLLNPEIVIPMHYQTEALKFQLQPVDGFLQELEVKGAVPQANLRITARSLPSETQVVVLDYRR
jgi:L-ascorbate metabolism protein UlaG (beta-lactamase superfamily)